MRGRYSNRCSRSSTGWDSLRLLSSRREEHQEQRTGRDGSGAQQAGEDVHGRIPARSRPEVGQAPLPCVVIVAEPLALRRGEGCRRSPVHVPAYPLREEQDADQQEHDREQEEGLPSWERPRGRAGPAHTSDSNARSPTREPPTRDADRQRARAVTSRTMSRPAAGALTEIAGRPSHARPPTHARGDRSGRRIPPPRCASAGPAC